METIRQILSPDFLLRNSVYTSVLIGFACPLVGDFLVLRRLVNVFGEDNDTSSGAWGTFAKAVEGSAKLLGNKAAIRALKTGEEHGVNVLPIGDRVLIAAGFPQTADRIGALGRPVRVLDNSELRKAEGALTCCSLIFVE